MLQQARCCKHGRRWTTATVLQVECGTSLVVSSGVDCGRWWNVYDKKPQRYAKDNRTAHLTARSDKFVAYVTNNKSLYSMFCTVEANYWQTWNIFGLFATADLLVTKLGKMTGADNAMNPQHYGSDSTDIRIQVGINLEIRIRILDCFWLTFWPWRSLRSLSALVINEALTKPSGSVSC